MTKREFTLMELLIVVAIIGILLSILLPSLSRANEKAKFAVCSSNRDQNYKLLITAVNSNDSLFPFFRSSGTVNPESPEIGQNDWAGTLQRDGLITNPVAGEYTGGFESIMRCPSLEEGVYNSGSGSNGSFDYSFQISFGGIKIFKIDNMATWLGQEKSTPMIVEESPRRNINKRHIETAFGMGDSLGDWHDFGKKIGYISIDGSSEIVFPRGVRYRSDEIIVEYEGSLKPLGSDGSLESWPRFH